MSPEQRLLKYFEQISEAPDAVARLRRFVLDLAVRGKLVEQDPNDEPVDITGQKSSCRLNKVPYDVPGNWVWAVIGDVLDLQYGKALSPADRHDHGKVSVYGSNGVVGHCENALTEASAIIIGRKGSAGALNVCEGPSWTTDVAYYVVPPSQIDIHFLYFELKTLDLESLGKGVKPGLNRNEVYQLPIAIPPLVEQRRIVDRVDELMALCDELEAAQAKRERRRDRLVAAALHGLNNGDEGQGTGGKTSFEESARFYLNLLPKLTVRPEHVQQLRQTILNLAVRGKLVRQEPNDEPAAAVLRRIDQERAVVAQVDRRAETQRQDLLAEELKWEVPSTWNWSALGDLALFIDYRGQTPVKTSSGIRLITAKNVRSGYLSMEPEEFVAPSTYDSWMTRGLPVEGDVLFTTEAPMGNAAVVRISEPFALAQRTICFRLFGGLIPEFVVLEVLSPQFQRVLEATATGLTAKGIKAAKLKRLPFAVPPLEEQSRIVATVDGLVSLCDAIEAGQHTATDLRRKLCSSVLCLS